MMSSISELFAILESVLPGKVFRDFPPDEQEYPYLIVEFAGERNEFASNKLIREKAIYQLAYITEGVERELQPIKVVLKEKGILHEPFVPDLTKKTIN